MKKFNVIIFFLLLLETTISEAFDYTVHVSGVSSNFHASLDGNFTFTGEGIVKNSTFSGDGEAFISGDIAFDGYSKLHKSKITVYDDAVLTIYEPENTIISGTPINVRENGTLNLATNQYATIRSEVQNLGITNTNLASHLNSNITNGDNSDKGTLNIDGDVDVASGVNIKQNTVNVSNMFRVNADNLMVNNLNLKDTARLYLTGGTLSENIHFTGNNAEVYTQGNMVNNTELNDLSLIDFGSYNTFQNNKNIQTSLLQNWGTLTNGGEGNANAIITTTNNMFHNTDSGKFTNYGTVDSFKFVNVANGQVNNKGTIVGPYLQNEGILENGSEAKITTGTFINFGGSWNGSTYQEGGTINNFGLIESDSFANRANSIVNNEGTIVAPYLQNEGRFTNNGTVKGDVANILTPVSSWFINNGTIDGNVTVTGIATPERNSGIITGNLTTTGLFNNEGQVNGNVVVTSGSFYNHYLNHSDSPEGIINGTLHGEEGTFIDLRHGTIKNLESKGIVFVHNDGKEKELILTGPINVNELICGGRLKLTSEAVQSTDANPIKKLNNEGNVHLDTQNGSVDNLKIEEYVIKMIPPSIAFDVDLANKKMDTLGIDSMTIQTFIPEQYLDQSRGSLDDIQLLSDANTDVLRLNLFSDDTPESVKSEFSYLLKYTPKKVSLSNIASYDTYYDRVTSQLVFIRSFNPYVHSSAVTTQTLGLVTSDLNGIALGQLTPEKDESQGNLWVKTVGLNDRFEFDSIPTVDAEMFSVLSGVTSDKIKLGHSAMQLGAYIGYLGGTNKYASNKMEEEGGYLGLSAAWSKGNFVLDTTLNAGFVRNNSSNFYGKDKYNSTWLSAGMKAGYGFNIADFTLQPNFYVGYTMVDTEDYDSVAGVHFDNEKAYFVEYSPGLKLSKSFNSWQGYIQGKYAFFENKEGKMTVNGINLPDLSTRNYAEYGIGLSKDFSNYWQFLMQANRRDGGRTGWNGSLELKYKF